MSREFGEDRGPHSPRTKIEHQPPSFGLIRLGKTPNSVAKPQDTSGALYVTETLNRDYQIAGILQEVARISER